MGVVHHYIIILYKRRYVIPGTPSFIEGTIMPLFEVDEWGREAVICGLRV